MTVSDTFNIFMDYHCIIRYFDYKKDNLLYFN